MTPLRVLVTGCEGQLGRELMEVLDTGGAHAPEVAGIDINEVDITARDAMIDVIDTIRPGVIVHTAAYTAVDECETQVDTAYRVNAIGTRNVVEAAGMVGAHVCYISTDYVFDGTASRPYREWDAPNPASVYGASKFAGELEMRPQDTIVRTSWVCGYHGANMVKTVVRLAAGDGPMRFVDDQRGCPTFTADLAVAVRDLALSRRPGRFHVTNQGATTWYEFATAIVEAAGGDPARVVPITTAELDPPRPAPRPANSVLDNMALRLSGLALLPDWHAALGALVKRLTR